MTPLCASAFSSGRKGAAPVSLAGLQEEVWFKPQATEVQTLLSFYSTYLKVCVDIVQAPQLS